MINFKEWLNLDEARFKGMKRQFLQQHPNMPKYVADDLYNARHGYTMNRHLQGDARAANYGTPSKIFNAFGYQDYQWQGPQILQGRSGQGVTPADFNTKTQNSFIDRRFGYREEVQIPNDAARTKTQQGLLNGKAAGSNEPIIVVQSQQGFELLEGWHRTMQLLLQGAPPDQLEVVQSGYLNDINFRNWRPVQINAYMGMNPANLAATPASQIQQQNQQARQQNLEIGTGEYVPAGSGRSIA